MDSYSFEKTRIPGIWELGTLDPIPLKEIAGNYYTLTGKGHIKSDRRIRQLMEFLGFKYRPRHIKNPQIMNDGIGWHVDYEDRFLVCNPDPGTLKRWPWMITLVAADGPTKGTKIRRFYYKTYLETWKIYLIHRCVIHDSPEPELYEEYRIMNRYDIHQFPEPECLHAYRRKIRNKYKAIAQALLKD